MKNSTNEDLTTKEIIGTTLIILAIVALDFTVVFSNVYQQITTDAHYKCIQQCTAMNKQAGQTVCVC